MSTRFLFIFVISSLFAASAHAGINEALVFEWWDEGIISPDEAEEMLELIDEGNESEACLLAEMYAQVECNASDSEDSSLAEVSENDGQPSNKKTKRKTKRASRSDKQAKRSSPPIRPSGYFLWRTRLDSNGHMASHREELQISFYRYTLRLGSQELLTYRNSGSEAHFGDVSTRELHSQIPLDTLWGVALQYPLGPFYLAGMLDTSATTEGRLGFAPDKKNKFEFFLWNARNVLKNAETSMGLQTNFQFGKTAVWWVYGGDFPLLKFQLQGNNKSDEKEPLQINWKTTAYIHGNSVPEISRLSSTILKSRIWASQILAISAPDAAHTKVTGNVRFLNPLHSDSISARIKADIQSGPRHLRPGFNATCLEAYENCRKDDFQAKLESSPADPWAFTLSAKSRYTRNEGLGIPRLEIGTRFSDSEKNQTRLSLVLPKGFSQDKLEIRNELSLHADFLDFSFVSTLKKSSSQKIRPSRTAISMKVIF